MKNCVANHLNAIHPSKYDDSPKTKNKKQPKGDPKNANEGIISGIYHLYIIYMSFIYHLYIIYISFIYHLYIYR